MDILSNPTDLQDDIIALFRSSFTASEGATEGQAVSALAAKLLRDTPAPDLAVYAARDQGVVIAAAIFSRLTYSADPRSVFILSPMAVAPDRQGQGLGQALLRHALAALRGKGVEAALTYGDPAFYGKLGFRPLDLAEAASPLPLSQPVGWIGQSLTAAPLLPLKGTCRCVAALDDPSIW